MTKRGPRCDRSVNVRRAIGVAAWKLGARGLRRALVGRASRTISSSSSPRASSPPRRSSLADPGGHRRRVERVSPCAHGRRRSPTTRSGPGSCCPAARALHRAGRAPRAAGRPGGSLAAARRRPRVHRAGLPARHARDRRHPAGRLRAGAVAAGSDGWAAWIETEGPRRAVRARRRRPCCPSAAGPLRVHLFTHPTPFARLRAFLRLTGFPAVLPEWGYGHWKSRDVYPHQRDAEADYRGLPRARSAARRDRARLALGDAIQHVGVQPAPVPGRRGLRVAAARRRRADRRVGRAVGEPRVARRPVPARRGVRPAARRARAQLRAGDVRARRGRRAVRRALVDGHRLARRLHVARSPRSGGASRPSGVLSLGVEGIKADDGEGWYLPDDVRFADGRTGAEAAWGHGLLYRRSMQRALDEVHPGSGVLFGRPGWTGQQAVGVTWGGDQPSDFWSLRTLVAATLTAAASGFSNWSHDVGGYLGERLVVALPEGVAAAVGAVRLLHAADARARALRAGGVDVRRGDAGRLPGVRAAARAARPVRARGGGDRRRGAACRSCARWRDW